MQGDFELSKFQLGILAAIFMVGLMIASVLLTQLTHRVSPFRLIGATADALSCLCVSPCPLTNHFSFTDLMQPLHTAEQRQPSVECTSGFQYYGISCKT